MRPMRDNICVDAYGPEVELPFDLEMKGCEPWREDLDPERVISRVLEESDEPIEWALEVPIPGLRRPS